MPLDQVRRTDRPVHALPASGLRAARRTSYRRPRLEHGFHHLPRDPDDDAGIIRWWGKPRRSRGLKRRVGPVAGTVANAIRQPPPSLPPYLLRCPCCAACHRFAQLVERGDWLPELARHRGRLERFRGDLEIIALDAAQLANQAFQHDGSDITRDRRRKRGKIRCGSHAQGLEARFQRRPDAPHFAYRAILRKAAAAARRRGGRPRRPRPSLLPLRGAFATLDSVRVGPRPIRVGRPTQRAMSSRTRYAGADVPQAGRQHRQAEEALVDGVDFHQIGVFRDHREAPVKVAYNS